MRFLWFSAGFLLGRHDGARAALDDDDGGGRVSDPYIPSRIREGARPGSAQSIPEAITSDYY